MTRLSIVHIPLKLQHVERNSLDLCKIMDREWQRIGRRRHLRTHNDGQIKILTSQKMIPP